MRCWRTCAFTVLLLVVTFPSLCRSAANETFVNNAKSKLKILTVFGYNGKSHFDVVKPLLEELARRGHELTVLSHFPRSENAKSKEALPTYKDINLLDPKFGECIIDLHNVPHTLRILKDLAVIQCRISLKHPAVNELLRSDEQFDLIITEVFNTDCFLGFVHRFKAPYIIVSTHAIMVWTNSDISNVNNPSYIPVIFKGFIKPMSFSDRLENMLMQLFSKVLYDYWFRPDDQAIAKEVFGPDLPELKEIAKQPSALLVNTHVSLYGNVPHLSNVVEIGGIHIPPKTNPLPKDLAEFLDNASEGVLYFNLGSVIKMATIPRKKLDAILEVFDSIPRKVILKWEEDVLPRKIDNVMTKKWLPQFDVLSK